MKGEIVASQNQSPYIFNHPMADHRYRYPMPGSGRRSPTVNPARASMPVNVGYGSIYGGDIHAVPTGRYDAAAPRRTGDHHHHHRPATTTITTYNVTKDPAVRSGSARDPSRNRHRSATIDTGSVKPIIVTTNHSRPHNASSHTSSSTSRRPESPSRDPYRSSEETYYTQPASSIRSRSHQRHHSANYDQEDIYRMRERLGDDRLRAPARPHSRQAMYTNTPRASANGFAEDYEYTKPSDLARYDLDHDRPRSRASRRDSFDRGTNYYRPSVSVVTNDIAVRPERRAPPTSAALDRYNKSAAAGIYERGSVAMPALPAVPAAPLVDPARRSGLLDRPASPATDRRSSRPRPISLYQDPAPRMDDLAYRPRDESLHRDRRERERGDESFRDDAVAARGFGLRPELLDQAEHRRPIEPEWSDRRDVDEHRSRRDYDAREPMRRSDEDLDKSRGRHERRMSEARDRPPRVEESRDRKDNKGEKMRDKVVAGLGVAAAAIGLGGAKDKEKDEKASPRRRRDSELPEPEPLGSRAADRYKPREAEIERRSSPREEPVVVEQRREAAKERPVRRDESTSREREREREREKERQREREKERERERERIREREKESERELERNRRDAEAKLSGSKVDARENSPYSDDSAGGPSRRRQRPSAAFDPTDTRGLMDLKAELAAIDPDKPKEKEKPRERTSVDTVVSAGSERQATSSRDRERARDESRGRELALVETEQKQVRVVSPPRDRSEQRPVKGILKQPTSQFPEDANPIREGVAPHKDDKTKKDVPQGARWTKINRRMVNPEALTIGKERFEVRDDFVIVLRVLSKEEIQAYATATAQLREMRRKEYDREQGGRDSPGRDHERDRDEEERRRRHRHRREREDEGDSKDRDADRERDYHRRHRREGEDDRPRALEYDDHSRHHHHRSHRDRDLETIASSATDDRR